MHSSDQNTHNRRLGPTPGVRLVLSALCASLSALAIVCATAQALPARGRVLSGSFAGPGSGAGQLSAPAGVAVDEASGDVYVVDRANNRIERFGPHGEFISAWGWGVRDGKPEYEICQSDCQAGIAGDGQGQLHDPEAIAIDNSANPSDPSRGDVYVVSDGRARTRASGEVHRRRRTARRAQAVRSANRNGKERWMGSRSTRAAGCGSIAALEAEGVVERFTDATPTSSKNRRWKRTCSARNRGLPCLRPAKPSMSITNAKTCSTAVPAKKAKRPARSSPRRCTSSGETLQLHAAGARPAADRRARRQQLER